MSVTDLHAVQCLPLLSLCSVLSHWRIGGLCNVQYMYMYNIYTHKRLVHALEVHCFYTPTCTYMYIHKVLHEYTTL